MSLKKSHGNMYDWVNWQYVAGFFDGEGSVFATKQIRKDGRIASRINISLTNTNEEVIKAISEFTDLKLKKYFYKNNTGKHLRIDIKSSGSKSINFLKSIYPYSIARKKQIKIAIRFMDTIRDKKSLRGRLTVKELEDRENMLKEIKSLNRSISYAT